MGVAGLREGKFFIRSNLAFQKYFWVYHDLEGMLLLKILDACKKYIIVKPKIYNDMKPNTISKAVK